MFKSKLKSKLSYLSSTAFFLSIGLSGAPLSAMDLDDENHENQSSPKKRHIQELDSPAAKKLKPDEIREVSPPTAESIQVLKDKAREGAQDEMMRRSTSVGLRLDPATDLKDFLNWTNLEERILTKPGYAEFLFTFFKDQYAQKFPDIVSKIKERAEREKDPLSQCNLGWMYEYGYGVAKDTEKAVDWYTKAANQGDARAQCSLGWMYEQGNGVGQSDEQAVHWYTKAANKGNARAQNNLGLMYQKGKGVEPSNEQAVHWYTKAAKKGDTTAQCNLGIMYEEGKGVGTSNEQAVYWYAQAANQGDSRAQNNLGLMYQNGKGVGPSNEQAVHWYTQAAKQGYAKAQNNLGLMLKDGEGIKKNRQKAVQYFRMAANQGDTTAQSNLGEMYEKGMGVKRNKAEALKWYMLSKAPENKDFIKGQLRLRPGLQPHSSQHNPLQVQTILTEAWVDCEFMSKLHDSGSNYIEAAYAVAALKSDYETVSKFAAKLNTVFEIL